MEIIGYSERGIINSLFYEIYYHQNRLSLLNNLLSLISFPFCEISFSIEKAEILIEQSFSNFGNADLVLLLDNEGRKQSMFLEAKVKTYLQRHSIQRDFKKFVYEVEVPHSMLDKPKMNPSNLFTQLYRKVRMMKALQEDGISSLKKGLEFPGYDKLAVRKIGKNEIVLSAVEKLPHYCDDAFFVALVPDSPSELKACFKDMFKKDMKTQLMGWDIKNWGYLSWEEVYSFCKKFGLGNTLKVFEFNKGQIYKD